MEKWFLRNRICEVIEYVGAVVFIALSASSISTSQVQASVCAFVTYLFIGIMRCLQYDILDTPRGAKIKKLLCSVIPSVIVLIVVLVLENNTNKYNKDVFETASQIAVAVILGLIIFEFDYYGIKDKNTIGMNLLKYKILSRTQITIYKVSYYLSRVLVVLGLVLVISVRSEFISATNIGCIIWGFNKLFWMYCWYNCTDINDVQANGEGYDDTSSDISSANADYNRSLNDHDVYLLVKEIADRWTGRENTSFLLPGSGSIRYNVTVTVSGGNRIDYTINGKFIGVRDEYLNEARIHLGSQMDKAAIKIAEETKRELSKHNILSSYEVNVRKGYIE